MIFFCSELKLGIEIDGESHNEQKEYDKMRTLNLNNIGIKIIRYSNAEIMCNLGGVYLDLEQKVKEREEELQKLTPFFPPYEGGQIQAPLCKGRKKNVVFQRG